MNKDESTKRDVPDQNGLTDRYYYFNNFSLFV